MHKEPCIKMNTKTTLQTQLFHGLIEAAKTHGQESEPDHEVGDLQDALSEIIELVPDKTLLKLIKDERSECVELLSTWHDGIDELTEIQPEKSHHNEKPRREKN